VHVEQGEMITEKEQSLLLTRGKAFLTNIHLLISLLIDFRFKRVENERATKCGHYGCASHTRFVVEHSILPLQHNKNGAACAVYGCSGERERGRAKHFIE
jgi:hypothetical protein